MGQEQELEQVMAQQIYFIESGIKKPRFKVKAMIEGKGGYGNVWEVEDLMTKEVMAMKIAKKPSEADESGDESYKKKFTIERQALIDLIGHPNIIKYKDIRVDGTSGGQKVTSISNRGNTFELIFMEKAVGDLGWIIETDVKKFVNGIAGICDALHDAHSRQTPIYVRDIKESHILVCEYGRYKLADFGEARITSAIPTTNTKKGTAEYRPPEAFEDVKKMEHPSADLYQLAVTIWNCMNKNKKIMFYAAHIDEKLSETKANEQIKQKLLEQKNDKKWIIKRVQEIESDLPKEFKHMIDVIAKAVDPDPINRYQSAEDFKMDMIPIYREFNSVYRPLKESLDGVVYDTFLGDFRVISLETAKKIASAKDAFDSFVIDKGLAEYIPMSSLKSLIEKESGKDKPKAETRRIYSTLKSEKEGPKLRYGEIKTGDQSLAVKVTEVNKQYWALVERTRGAIKKFLPHSVDDNPDFCKVSSATQDSIVDTLNKNNVVYLQGLIDKKEMNVEQVKAMTDHYTGLSAMLCIL